MKQQELSALLKKETWESVYKDPNHMFNSLLCTFVNILQASFPVKYTNRKRMTGLHMANIKGAYMPSVRTIIILKKNRYTKYSKILIKRG